MMRLIKSMLRDDTGATAIEYGLIAALIAVAGLVALGAIGENLNTTFETVGDRLAEPE